MITRQFKNPNSRIILIRGVSKTTYDEIRSDLTQQLQDMGESLPLFALLPSDYTDIDVLWLDEEMERDNFLKTLETMKAKVSE